MLGSCSAGKPRSPCCSVRYKMSADWLACGWGCAAFSKACASTVARSFVTWPVSSPCAAGYIGIGARVQFGYGEQLQLQACSRSKASIFPLPAGVLTPTQTPGPNPKPKCSLCQSILHIDQGKEPRHVEHLPEMPGKCLALCWWAMRQRRTTTLQTTATYEPPHLPAKTCPTSPIRACHPFLRKCVRGSQGRATLFSMPASSK